MKTFPAPARRSSAFTLVEVLVAMAVLAILVLMINALFSGASTTITTSRHHMDADSEARLVFSRMANDFAGMVKRTDVDQLFAQESSNDGMWFYSQAPAVYSDTSVDTVTTLDPKNPIALVGYRIAGAAGTNRYQLERVGVGLTWDNNGTGGNAANNVYQGMVLLTRPPPNSDGTTSSVVWDPASTLSGTFPKAIGPSPYNQISSATPNASYHVIGDDVFRMEICFLLKDGTYSKYPLKWNLTPNSLYTNTSSSPIATVAGTVGARWVNSDTCQTYICTATSLPTDPVASSTWTGSGMQDVAAIVVTLAILDHSSQSLVPAATLNSISDNKLADPTESSLHSAGSAVPLPAQLWQTTITNANFAQSVGVPVVAASQIRIYQRYFYLNQ